MVAANGPMRKYPILWFYVLAFVISWLGWIPLVAGSRGISPFDSPVFQILLILPGIGPTVAALAVTRASIGKAGTDAWFRSLWRWRVNGYWLGAAIVLPGLFLAVGKVLTQALDLPVVTGPANEDRVGSFVATLVIALLSNPWEEVGWRGFALPRLQKRHTALGATLIAGALWGLWHLPLFFWADNPMSRYPFFMWFVGTIAEAFVYTWLYNSTRGSVLVVALYHVLMNAYGALITGISVVGGSIVSAAVAVVLIGVFGKEHLARSERVRAG